jgi:hypothetical protein
LKPLNQRISPWSCFCLWFCLWFCL